MIDWARQTKTRTAIEMIVTALVLIALFLLIYLGGCASVRVTKTLPDGTINEYEYIRWFDQTIEGLKIKTPEGYEVILEGQKSLTEMAFDLGVISGKAGGSK
jgi:hypothetical protein